MRKAAVNALFLLFIIVGILCGCATPGSLREAGPACVFTVPNSTPRESGRCLVDKIDERCGAFNPILRDKTDGNATILLRLGGDLVAMFDINKEGDGVNILLYFEYGNTCDSLAYKVCYAPALGSCGAKEKVK